MNQTEKRLEALCGGPIREADHKTLYGALLKLIHETAAERQEAVRGRKLYYISAEFLIGRLLTSNLIALGLYEDIGRILKRAGKSLNDLVREGLSSKLMRMPEDVRGKIQESLQKIINEGSGGMICILL